MDLVKIYNFYLQHFAICYIFNEILTKVISDSIQKKQCSIPFLTSFQYIFFSTNFRAHFCHYSAVQGR